MPLMGTAGVSQAGSDLPRGPTLQLDQRNAAQIYRDKGGQLTFSGVLALPASDWQPLTGHLSEGFTTAAVWVRFRVDHLAPPESTDWYMELSQPLLADVRLYTKDTAGQVVERFATTLSDQQQRELPLHKPTLHLHQQAYGSQEYWLRISTPTALNTSLNLRPSEALILGHEPEGFGWGLALGAYACVLVLYTLFWLWTRLPLHGYYSIYIAINFLAALLTSGWLLPFWGSGLHADYLRLLGVAVAVSVATSIFFSSEFLRLHVIHPSLARWLKVSALVISAAGSALVLGGYYGVAVPFIQAVSIVAIATLFMIAVRQAFIGYRLARIFLMAFSAFYVGVSVRYLRNFGIVEPGFWSDNSYQIGAAVHVLIMSFTLFAGYNRMRAKKGLAESRLRYESQRREDQRKFVDMISHELRTPLSVIQATVDNLHYTHQSQEETIARLDKIARAGNRMSALVQNYLATERTMVDMDSPDFGHHALADLCHQAVADLPDGDGLRVQVLAPPHQSIRCDARLLKIAILNLLHNACRHSFEDQPVRLTCQAKNGRMTIEVADLGEGVPADEVEHLFKRHYRGQNGLNRSGAGLGLYIVQSIVEAHRGHIHVRANLLRGSIFTIDLPL